jgi:tripeptide aminopeptidase
MKVHERFLNYVKIDTQSVHDAEKIPSSEKQKDLGRLLVEEMISIGIEDAYMDENGYVYGTVKGNTDAPVIGFIAHMDTSPDMPGSGVKPKIIYNYDGSDIMLNDEKQIVMKTEMFEHLSKYIDQDLIVTDGTTLLGADDKAGIAEIMSMAEYLINNPQIKHGTIKIGFTPDEEVGQGAELFNIEKFGADYAYTVDGGEIGELEYENFNAASAKVTINGVNIHPGTAKNKMKNSILIGMEFHNMLPVYETPENTEGYEGFSLLTDMSGNVEKTLLEYIIRDHDIAKFNIKKERFQKIAVYDRDKETDPAEKVKMMKKALTSDVFLTSANAITMDGELLNIDANGNRLAAYCYGPNSVIVVAGMNKIVTDLDIALKKARLDATVPNTFRTNSKAPCHFTGKCIECTMSDTLCGQILITRFCKPKNRIKVILVGENLGF